MEQITQYFTENYITIIPFLVLILELLIRKIPTFDNFSIFYHVTKILDVFAPNNTIKKDSKGFKKISKFITRNYKQEKDI